MREADATKFSLLRDRCAFCMRIAAMNPRRIGIVGLGLLGGAIARKLREAGYAPTGFDMNAERRSEAEASGISVVADAAELVKGSDVVLLSLPDGEVVDALLAELKPQWRSGQTVVDTTTAAPRQMLAHAEVLRPLGVGYVEAEIAGSSAQVTKKEVLVFAGGDEADVSAVREILEAFAAEVRYVGPTGTAARWKLVHNLILGLHRAVLAEGLALAESLGLDAASLLDVLRRTPAASAVMETKGPKMLNREFTPQATVRQHLKDVRLIIETAARAGAGVPLSRLHQDLLERAIALGYSEADNSAIVMALLRDPTGEEGRDPDDSEL
ncbi:MAG: hypothetical protein C0483_08690 [Pirellula sp.]|nr:hypothetical protein [Pirellula sp.]